ncbi:hypothetical protein BT69DRAFT_1315250 [Atractiella rhizophila]|nr:hypothetical protein BT69DRAFT_1315250 [Atractiella rhizophila]
MDLSLDSLSSLEFGAVEPGEGMEEKEWDELSECSEAESSLLDEEELRDFRILKGHDGETVEEDGSEEGSEDGDCDGDLEDATIKLLDAYYVASPRHQFSDDISLNDEKENASIPLSDPSLNICEKENAPLSSPQPDFNANTIFSATDSPNLISFSSPSKPFLRTSCITHHPATALTDVFSPPPATGVFNLATTEWNSFPPFPEIDGQHKGKLIDFDESPLKERTGNIDVLKRPSENSPNHEEKTNLGHAPVVAKEEQLKVESVEQAPGDVEDTKESSKERSPSPPSKVPKPSSLPIPVSKSATTLPSRIPSSRIAVRSTSTPSILSSLATKTTSTSSPKAGGAASTPNDAASATVGRSASLSPPPILSSSVTRTTISSLQRQRATSVSRVSPIKPASCVQEAEQIPSVRTLRRPASALALSPSKPSQNQLPRTGKLSPPKRVLSPVKADVSFASPTANSLLRQRTFSSLSLSASLSGITKPAAPSPAKGVTEVKERPKRGTIAARRLKDSIVEKEKEQEEVGVVRRTRRAVGSEKRRKEEEEEKERRRKEEEEEERKKKAALVFGAPSSAATTTPAPRIATRSTRITRSASAPKPSPPPQPDTPAVTTKRLSPPLVLKKRPSLPSLLRLTDSEVKQLTKENTTANCRLLTHQKVVTIFKEENRPPSPTAKIRRTNSTVQLKVSREERAIKRRALKKSTDSARRASMGLGQLNGEQDEEDDEDEEPLQHFRAPGDDEQFFSPVKKRTAGLGRKKEVKWDKRLVERDLEGEELSVPEKAEEGWDGKGCIKTEMAHGTVGPVLQARWLGQLDSERNHSGCKEGDHHNHQASV